MAPALDYKKDKNNSSWLPTENLMKTWKVFHLGK
jgi:hypothetical protein